MAMICAKEMSVDECLVLNTDNRICESAIANIFVVKNNYIYTPPLSEGCVAGVVRSWILKHLPTSEFTVKEKEITQEDIQQADELFLTNSMKPVRWVKTFKGKEYGHKITNKISEFIQQNMI